jgi:hypothetical protein
VDIGERHSAEEIITWLRAPEEHHYIRLPKSGERS